MPHPAAPHERIIYALDVPDRAEARRQVGQLAGVVGVFKVGLELFVREGPEVVRMVREEGGDVFLDLKLHDIPATMLAAVRSAAALHPKFLTLHAEAVVGAGDEFPGAAPGVALLGVTALTSLSADHLAALGYAKAFQDPAEMVLKRAAMARDGGCAGVVCSGREAHRVRGRFGADFLIVTPGIRPVGSDADDQARAVTPSQAVAAGADYLVVGRPIRRAPDPRDAARRIADEIARAAG